MKIALIGYGKMGKEVEKVAIALGHEITTIVHDSSWDAEELKGAEVAIEFTEPTSAVHNIRKILMAEIPVIVGTTGWYEHLDEVEKMVADSSTALLWAPNFSLGIGIFLRIVHQAATLVNRFDHYDIGGYEIHHRQKKDAPSGTAHAICIELLKGIDRKTGMEFDTPDGILDSSLIHYPSLRLGHVPGTHAVVIDAAEETIKLTHEARSRGGFARGAVMAAEWIQGKKGSYRFEDLLDEVLR
jgi:4-hydroxy-tetrahydrodipicolinate reductase